MYGWYWNICQGWERIRNHYTSNENLQSKYTNEIWDWKKNCSAYNEKDETEKNGRNRPAKSEKKISKPFKKKLLIPGNIKSGPSISEKKTQKQTPVKRNNKWSPL